MNHQSNILRSWLLTMLVSCLRAASMCNTEAVAQEPTFPTVVDRLQGREQSPAFRFPRVSLPIKNDAGTGAAWRILGEKVDANADPNSGGLSVVHNGKMPTASDQPAENFFFDTRSRSGRILVDLKRLVPVQHISTYSWHPGERADQVFELYGGRGDTAGFVSAPAPDVDPASCGYTLLATIDTRGQIDGGGAQRRGGQVAVQVGSETKPLGDWQYLIWQVSVTDKSSRFSNTFFSEIDVVEVGTQPEPAVVERPIKRSSHAFDDGRYTITIDTTEAPDLTQWTEEEALPEIIKWYPKIVALLPSDDFTAPNSIKLVFLDSYNGVAATSGDRIVCSPSWFRRQLKGEAKGAIVHELVHVVQQYPFWRRGSGKNRAPGWLVEGLADYIRWHLYEPQDKGNGVAGQSPKQMKHNASYRQTASFLGWVIDSGHPDLLGKLNATIRNGNYNAEFWSSETGVTIEALAERWNAS